MSSTVTRIARTLEQYLKVLETYQRSTEDTRDEYAKLDKYKEANLIDYISSIRVGLSVTVILGLGNDPFANWKGKMSEVVPDTDEERDLLSTVKTLLKGIDKQGDVDEAGVLKDVISYFGSSIAFFSGDKKGPIGASDWCNLTDSSIGVRTDLYNCFCGMYKGLKIGLFGDVAQENIRVLGLLAGFLSLTASILSASSRLDNKQWQSIVADYVNYREDMLSVVKPGHALKHIGDARSLSEVKAGPWSALNIYSAIGGAGIQSTSQGPRSHEKYYAGDQWDVDDTGATGIDISMAGTYGINHNLMLGFDDLIFGAIDNATGGNGMADMSYFEKAVEGCKISANKCGEATGN